MNSEKPYYTIQKEEVKSMVQALDKLNRAIRILDVLDTNLVNDGQPGQAEISGIILNDLRQAKAGFQTAKDRLQVAIDLADNDNEASQKTT